MSNNDTLNNNGSNDSDFEFADGALTELKNQYDTLVKEIKTKHNEQQKIFQDMAKSEYDGSDYEQDRINHLIETNVSNLKQQRDNIWKYLSQKYNKHTQQTYTNFKRIKNNEKQLVSNSKRKEVLKKELEDVTSKNETQKKLIQHNLYQHKTLYNKTYIQFVITVGLIISIILLYLTSIDTIDSQIGYGAVGIIGLIVVLYYIYRMYIYRVNRDKFYWHKIYFRRMDTPKEVKDEEDDIKPVKIDYNELDKKAKTAFSQYKSTCQSSNVSTL